jgi:hypothetical protein
MARRDRQLQSEKMKEPRMNADWFSFIDLRSSARICGFPSSANLGGLGGLCGLCGSIPSSRVDESESPRRTLRIAEETGGYFSEMTMTPGQQKFRGAQ